MNAPVINTETELSLSDAKAEYRYLTDALKNCPQFGWVQYIETRIENRLEFLAKTIADKVCKEQE